MSGPETRTVLVTPERLAGWLERFERSHGPAEVRARALAVDARATDGSTVHCKVPFPPLPEGHAGGWQALTDHALKRRRFGVLLIRRGGYAAGVFDGPELIVSKVGTRYVQGRTAAGGTSQQRFARRRQNQASALLGTAIEVAARILAPQASTLAGLASGGDRPLIAAALADPRLAGLASMPQVGWLAVGDPRLTVLREAGEMARSVRITITDG